MTDTRPLASVVVAVHRDPRVRRLVASLACQTLPPQDYEVIIVENGSADLAGVEGAHGIVRYAHLPVANSAAARNVGLALARGRFLLLTDADCVARPDWAEKLTTGLAAGEPAGVAAVGGSIVKHEPRTWAQRHAITIVDGQQLLNYLPALHVPYVAGANAGYVTSRLREVGGFDEELKSGNDVDVCYKLGLRGYQIALRFNVTVIRDNLTQLEAIAELAGEMGARVVNFLTFNPYFEWARSSEIDFQPRHSEAAPYLAGAISACARLGVEANVRYLPLCQLPGYQANIYTGYQLPYDTHEWDYNSWYDTGHQGMPSTQWYYQASRRQQNRHGYVHVPECGSCAVREICDGFHAQYVTRWGGQEASPYAGPAVTDPRHFIREQDKVEYDKPGVNATQDDVAAAPVPLHLDAGGGAKARHKRSARR